MNKGRNPLAASRASNTAAGALLVFVGYLLGSWLGFRLTLPPASTSFLWPPNALLTATLLLTPARRWWIYLLAALPAHLAVQLQGGLPLALVLAFFATNCSEALIAAGLAHRFSDAPHRFNTLRRATVFIGGAVLTAPFVSCFLDAAAVASLRAEPYWRVWQTRFYSNTLTELTLVPALVTLVAWWNAPAPRLPLRRQAEAFVLLGGLLAVGAIVFGGAVLWPRVIPWAPHTSLALLLPFLLWAAGRFGPGGASLALLATALLAIQAATRGVLPLFPLPPAERVLSLQIFLLAAGVPLFVLASLIEERHAAEKALAARLRFEGLLSHLSGAFVHLPSDEMGAAFEGWLRQVGEFFRLERVLLISVKGEQPEVYCCWSAPGLPPLSLPETARLVRDQLRSSPQLTAADQPANGAGTWHHPDAGGAWISIPLVLHDDVLQGIAFRDARARATAVDQRLRLVAECFAQVLARKETEDALRASELMKSAILNSLDSLVAVLDREGRIIAVNETWSRFVRAGGATPALAVGLGVSYLEAGPDSLVVQEAAAGIQSILGGSRDVFSLESGVPGAGGERWFAMSVVPLRRPEGGAVVSHTEVTERRRAEMKAESSREELAHFLRVSTMGELTTSLAHELNQPLTAILANAQAARLLVDTPANLGEVREILSDIVDEDKRAGEMIRRIRGQLRKGERARSLLDVNTLVSDAVKLVRSTFVIRNVASQLDLTPALPMVSADYIQIQQVVLNLLLNAIEAMEAREPVDRLVTVRTECSDQLGVQVLVQDTGSGLGAEATERVFEAFYTTKPKGMGMGLAIARSIVEAHGGVIWARNSATGGATFGFGLPVSAFSEQREGTGPG